MSAKMEYSDKTIAVQVTMHCGDVATLPDVIETMVIPLLLAAGYAPKSIRRALVECGEDDE